MSRTYTNPVYPANVPDPFVLRFNGRYYAYGTGPAGDGRMFPLLSSNNLVEWEFHGGAMDPLGQPGLEEYWAPEVAYHEGRFYMYYAVGQAANPDHHLRLATAEHPLGPWRDAGVNLTPNEIFAIDAHPFRDPRDGQWYLFYARDELEPPHAGTGVVVDRLLAMDRLEGRPRPVLRPFADWQVFELKRAVKGGLDWYTIEGPFVLPHDGRYVCFYSGGRWEEPHYGVAYCLADHPLGPWKDEGHREGPSVLATLPGRVRGPGHNSIILGPDLLTPYVVYHGWDPDCTARYPRIDPLVWRDGRPRCDGPSWEPRPAPRLPDVLEWWTGAAPSAAWHLRGGGWNRSAAGLEADSGGSRLALREREGSFVAETSISTPHGPAGAGLSIGNLEVVIGPESLRAGTATAALPKGFRHEAWHTLTVRKEGTRLTATLDGFPTVTTELPTGPSELSLTSGAGARFAHFALTRLQTIEG
jgi:GH43 family beta-xylosidase